jgi:hypothetical protein
MKLTDAQTRILTFVKDNEWAYIGQLTNPAKREVHAPATLALWKRGLVELKGASDGRRAAYLTDKGRDAINGASSPSVKPEPKARPSMAPAADLGKPRPGEIVNVRSHDFIIIGGRRITKGRYVGWIEWTVAPMEEHRKLYAMKCRQMPREPSCPGFSKPRRTWTAAQAAEAKERYYATKEGILERKKAQADRGREAMGDVDVSKSWDRGEISCKNIAVGDVVTIEYRGGDRRDETVVKLNLATGKIAIRAPRYKMGYRWLPAWQVKTVKEPERALPTELTERERGTLTTIGWVQARRGREFIERSYVVALTKSEASSKGHDYECATHTVHRCPKTGYFWRDTGSFD